MGAGGDWVAGSPSRAGLSMGLGCVLCTKGRGVLGRGVRGRYASTVLTPYCIFEKSWRERARFKYTPSCPPGTWRLVLAALPCTLKRLDTVMIT